MESRLTTLGMGLVGGGIEQKSKRTHGHGQVWRLQGRPWVEVEKHIRGIYGNGKMQ